MTTTLETPKSWSSPISRPTTATLRFTVTSWAKFNYLRDLDDAEVFCFAITDPSDPLLVKDLWIPKQEVTSVSVDLDASNYAQRLEEMGEHAPLSTFTRIWLHTHPGDSASPSSTDVETQTKIFGNCEWAVMAILAKGGEFYSELMWWGPDGKNKVRVKIPWQIDWHEPFEGADPDRWSAEYLENVTRKKFSSNSSSSSRTLWPSNTKMGGPLTPDEEAQFSYLASRIDEQEGITYGSIDDYCNSDPAGWTT